MSCEDHSKARPLWTRIFVKYTPLGNEPQGPRLCGILVVHPWLWKPSHSLTEKLLQLAYYTWMGQVIYTLKAPGGPPLL